MQLLKAYQNIINQELVRIFNSLKRESIPKKLYQAMHYSVFNGGKRIRPVLCLATYDALQKKSKIQNPNSKLRKILPFACGLELIHTFSLIQDDLPSMDNDDYRRGKLSLHRKYNEAIALLAADALFAMAFELFAKAPVTDKKKIAAITELSKICGVSGLAAGQVLDIINKNQKLTTNNQKQIDEKKTACLIAGAMKIGAIVADAKAQVIKKIEKAGLKLGLLFQVTDDIIDKTQDSKLKIQNLKAQRYAQQAKQIIKPLGKNFDWFQALTNYILERKQ